MSHSGRLARLLSVTDLTAEFEAHRARLRAVAYRMLGSLSEADDAVQEAWLRLQRNDERIDNLRAWLTTVVARVALNQLRARKVRELHVPDPIVDPADGPTPEHAALLADSVGLALLVVHETLPPAERVAFELHDVFDLPFDQIAPIVDRTPDATRQLASRARRRVQARGPSPDADLAAQRAVVDAFLAAARDGDFRGLVAVLDPDVVLRSDSGALRPAVEVHGAEQVARGAQSYSRQGLVRQPMLVNGLPGAVAVLDGTPIAVMAFTVRGGRIAEIAILNDPERIAQLGLG
jgi:RNA polymerase sigma-70 factor (ECF subfamily)